MSTHEYRYSCLPISLLSAQYDELPHTQPTMPSPPRWVILIRPFAKILCPYERGRVATLMSFYARALNLERLRKEMTWVWLPGSEREHATFWF